MSARYRGDYLRCVKRKNGFWCWEVLSREKGSLGKHVTWMSGGGLYPEPLEYQEDKAKRKAGRGQPVNAFAAPESTVWEIWNLF